MNKLHIYPTSRALRTVSAELKEQSGFLPTLLRMDEFEHRAILLEEKSQVDAIERILFLREAASFEAFEEEASKQDMGMIRQSYNFPKTGSIEVYQKTF